MADPNRISFGGFVLNRDRGCLEDESGVERFLRPKSYRVLEVLSERRGSLVSKDDLIREAWPDVFVSDDSLAHCISDIRRALGPDGSDLLRTVPRRGYMLNTDTGPAPPFPRKATPRIIRAGGMLGGLMLASFGLWWWSPHVAPTSPPSATASAIEHAEALLDERDWQRRDANEQARRLLIEILAGDPENADALADLGLTYWLEVQHLAWGGGRREMDRALELVERSVALRESDRAYRLLAEMRLLSPIRDLRSPVDAVASARAAVTLGPEDPDNLAVLAEALALTGRPDEAVDLIERAFQMTVDPPQWHRRVAGLSYLLAGQPASAVENLGPLYGAGTFSTARWWPGWLYAASLAHAGRLDEAAGVVRAANGRRPEQTVSAVAQSFDGFEDEAGLGLVLEGLRLAGVPG